MPHSRTIQRILFAVLALTCTVQAAVAQRMLSGTVVDSKTGEKLPFVNVVYTNGGGTQTDLDGHFRLPFRAGRVRLSIIGYETKTIRVSAPQDSLVFRIDPM